jgi:hypothetical protein
VQAELRPGFLQEQVAQWVLRAQRRAQPALRARLNSRVQARSALEVVRPVQALTTCSCILCSTAVQQEAEGRRG